MPGRRLPPTPTSFAGTGGPARTVSASSACCRCNRTGICRSCSCVKAGQPCTNCLPGRLLRCRNPPSSPSTAPPALPPALPPSVRSDDADAQPVTPINALPSLDSITRLRSPTLHHVPKGARDDWALLLDELLTSLTASPTQCEGWQKLFMLPRCILFNLPRGGRSHSGDYLKSVRSRIRKWREGKISELWEEAVAQDNKFNAHLSRRNLSDQSLDSLRHSNVSRARRAVKDGQYRKALQSLTSAGLAQPSQPVVDEMRAKHPPSCLPTLPSGPAPPPVRFSEDEVAKALKSFPNGSAPGPSGLRSNHLKEAVFCPSPDRASRALRSLSQLVNILCAGNVPNGVIPHLCGASLLPCKKKNGGLRPIAVGEVIRRLVSKCAAKSVLPEALEILVPQQLGVGVPSGCEAIVHAVASLLDDRNIPQEKQFILLIDFSNAFNSVDRSALFREVREHTPGIAAWVECSYGAHPHLLLSDHTLFSCSGVQQGDPLGPLGFALALHPVVSRINHEAPGLLLNSWYLDDGTLCGSLDDLATALAIIESEGPPRGLILNRSKSLIIAPLNHQVTHPSLSDIPVCHEGFTLLGSPLGPANYRRDVALESVTKIHNSLIRLRDLQDSQMEASLLRSCLSLPKLIHLLRTCPPAIIRSALERFDEIMREAVSDLAGCPLSDWGWLKASLPSSLGGLNICQATLHAPAFFIGSVHQSESLICDILSVPAPTLNHLPQTICALSEAAGRPDWSSIENIDVPLRSNSLSHAIDDACFTALLASSPDIRSRALALSTAIPHAGDWLNVVPSPSLGLHLLDSEFRSCLRYWLGLRMFQDEVQCPVCHVVADPFGDHHVGCGGNGDRILRHNALRDAVFSAAQSAALAPRREVPSLIPNSQSRPADIFLPCWKRGQPAALDVAVISTMQRATVNGAASTQGHALLVQHMKLLVLLLGSHLSLS